MARSHSVEGHVSPSYEAVREAFGDNFARRGELGGACCAYYRGDGFADPATGVGYTCVTSQMSTALTGDPREVALRDALYAALPASSGAPAKG